MKWLLFVPLVISFQSLASPTLDLPAMTNLSGAPADYLEKSDKALLMFWATWCPSCKNKMVKGVPELSRRKDLTVIAVNTDEEPQRAEQFLKQQKVSLNNWADKDQKLRQLLGVKAVPHWVAIARVKGKWEVKDQGTELDEKRALSSLFLLR